MAVKRLLKDPTAKGLRRSHFTKIGKNGQAELRDTSEWYIHEAPAIVSKELWQQVNDIIDRYEASKTQPLNKKLKLFTGFLRCDCGGKMYVPSSNPKYTCKECKRKIPVDDMEEIFKHQLKNFLLSKEDIAAFFESSQKGVKEKERELGLLHDKIATVKSKISGLIELHQAGQIETKRFREFYDSPNEQLQQLELRIPALEGEIKMLKEQSKSSDFIIKEAQTLYDNWDSLMDEEKRSVVEAVVKDIVLKEGEVLINLYSFAPPQKPSSFSKLIANGQHGL
jgi:site-specific DNA recombinase